ncbi:hypothetical protein [Streptomyces sp. NPDC055105]|uniref:hypothetical protein n=1 Tax=Streptomyces sp. NPDC055105 TaxID=3365719 RepID=UPI0037D09A18
MDRMVYRALAQMNADDARPGVQVLARSDIRSWAEAEDGGRMDWPAAEYFTKCLVHQQYSFADDSGLQTNTDVLKAALDMWVNGAEEEGRVFEAEHDGGYSASDAAADARSYKWED